MKETEKDRYYNLGMLAARVIAAEYSALFPAVPPRIIESMIMTGYKTGWAAREGTPKAKKKGGKR